MRYLVILLLLFGCQDVTEIELDYGDIPKYQEVKKAWASGDLVSIVSNQRSSTNRLKLTYPGTQEAWYYRRTGNTPWQFVSYENGTVHEFSLPDTETEYCHSSSYVPYNQWRVVLNWTISTPVDISYWDHGQNCWSSPITDVFFFGDEYFAAYPGGLTNWCSYGPRVMADLCWIWT